METNSYLVLAKNGQLMTDVVDTLNYRKIECHAYNKSEVDVTNYDQLKNVVLYHLPTIIIQGASVHSVPDIENNPAYAYDVNVGTYVRLNKIITKIRNETENINYSPIVVNFTTNYMFSNKAYDLENSADEETIKNPINLYGQIKAASEDYLNISRLKHANIRVAGLFGLTGSRAKNNSNFVYETLKHLNNNEAMRVVNDQYMNITNTSEAADCLISILQEHPNYCFLSKNINITNTGICTWYDVAKFIAVLEDKEDLIIPISTESFYGDSILRPRYSQLKSTSWVNVEKYMSDWKTAIVKFMHELKKERK